MLANDPFASQAPFQANGGSGLASGSAFDPFAAVSSPLPAATTVGPVTPNPYAHDDAASLGSTAALGGAAGLGTTAGLGGTAFFANQAGFQQPV